MFYSIKVHLLKIKLKGSFSSHIKSTFTGSAINSYGTPEITAFSLHFPLYFLHGIINKARYNPDPHLFFFFSLSFISHFCLSFLPFTTYLTPLFYYSFLFSFGFFPFFFFLFLSESIFLTCIWKEPSVVMLLHITIPL